MLVCHLWRDSKHNKSQLSINSINSIMKIKLHVLIKTKIFMENHNLRTRFELISTNPEQIDHDPNQVLIFLAMSQTKNSPISKELSSNILMQLSSNILTQLTLGLDFAIGMQSHHELSPWLKIGNLGCWTWKDQF